MITDLGKDGLVHLSVHGIERVVKAPCGAVLLEYLDDDQRVTCLRCATFQAPFHCGHAQTLLRKCPEDRAYCNCCNGCKRLCVGAVTGMY